MQFFADYCRFLVQRLSLLDLALPTLSDPKLSRPMMLLSKSLKLSRPKRI